MLIQITDEKPCRDCHVVKHTSEFYKNPRLKDGLWSACKVCVRARIALRALVKPEPKDHKARRMNAYRQSEKGKATARAYYLKNIEKYREHSRVSARRRLGFQPRKPKRSLEEHQKAIRDGSLKTKYKIDQVVYDRMFKDQDGLCAICCNPPLGKKTTQMLAVDHCHATGRVRGLLCHKCNAAIGFFKDSPELVKKALDYLLLHI